MFSGIKKAVMATFTVEGITSLVIIFVVLVVLQLLHASPADTAAALHTKKA